MFISKSTFLNRLRFLRSRDFNVIRLEEACNILEGRNSILQHSVVITIDDGWYSTFSDMLPLLRQFSMPATIYCDTENLLSGLPVANVMARYLRKIHLRKGELPEDAEAEFIRATDLTKPIEQRNEAVAAFAAALKIDLIPYIASRNFAYMSPHELRIAQLEGFSIELHTHRHSLHSFRREEITDEINLNRRALSSILGNPDTSFRHFCYPSGVTNESAEPVLRELRISSATTLEPYLVRSSANPLRLPRILDGEHLTELDFEAEMCGVGHIFRCLKKRLAKI
jgi:peptidoglycan/xylan/chitin deacetylase (PgdA/CDA1 family)